VRTDAKAWEGASGARWLPRLGQRSGVRAGPGLGP
jgi:hypothetical protein